MAAAASARTASSKTAPKLSRMAAGTGQVQAWLRIRAAATSRHSYQRTRLTAAASPVILVLDATAVTAAALAAPAPTVMLGIAAGVSAGRIAFTAWTLPRLAAR